MVKLIKFLRPTIVVILTCGFLLIITQSYKRLERDEIATVMSMKEQIVDLPSITVCLEYSKADILSFQDASTRLNFLKTQVKLIFRISTDYDDE